TKTVIAKLKKAFDALADFPESVDEAIVPLDNAATTLAQDTRDWAAECNADFNPASVDDGATQFVVISDVDRGAYVPFFPRERAFEYAEAVDGSVFLCVAAAEEGER